ncbi:MAG TPA: YhcH/YjgK/YiaL family protein [Kiritimatiellia bacterium]|nr:YhcH/YjgK/YiaL family protein [Kiritimatiellia bacterium]
MIEDSLDRFNVYPMGPAWIMAFEFLSKLSPDVATGKQIISGNEFFAGIDTYQTKNRDEAKLETHRKYMDIQVLLSGVEAIEIFPRHTLTISEPYNPERDAEFYMPPAVAPISVTLTPGRFVALFPEDAHMPSLRVDQTPVMVKKVVVKVPVSHYSGLNG